MADSDKSKLPAWQRAQSGSGEAPSPESTTGAIEATLEQARAFLDDEEVRTSSKEKKTEFLKSKGLGDEDIQKLLSETPAPEPQPELDSEKQEASVETRSSAPASSQISHTASAPPGDAPPIITYPEFLTHSPRPPPLITPTRLLNILSASGTTLALLYGAARFIVGPMVETLNESRSDYYSHVNAKVGQLVEKLEGVVSEVPHKNGKPLKSEVEIEDDSSYDDPTEMFHRDVGTQTSPVTSTAAATTSAESPVDVQARRLAQITSSLKDLKDLYSSQAENSSNLQDTLREIRDDVDKLSYPPVPDYSSFYGGSGFGIGRTPEADDEYKKTKDAIRGVKGVLLSSRMFPVAAAK